MDKEYHIMHKNDIVAEADAYSVINVIKPELCPECIRHGCSLAEWLVHRSIDLQRSHFQPLMNLFRRRINGDITQLIRIGHGISITDNWWIQATNEQLRYESLKQYNAMIADVALFGTSEKQSEIFGYTELGTVGSLEKAWHWKDDAWYLCKESSFKELISEFYAYQFLKKMDVPTAEYTIQKIAGENHDIITKDFTNNADMDFEPFANYFYDETEPDVLIPRLMKMGNRFVLPYVTILFYDALLLNGDRHNENIGFLRDSRIGELLELAPNFDYNLALAGFQEPYFNIKKGSILTNEFVESEYCCTVMKEHIPERSQILNATRYATEMTTKIFPQYDYSVFENYILYAYDDIAKNYNRE